LTSKNGLSNFAISVPSALLPLARGYNRALNDLPNRTALSRLKLDRITTVYTRSSELAQLRPSVAVSVTVELLRTW
jgi:hypothetical protein